MGSGEGLCPPQLGSGGLPPRKKNQFCAKNYAILSQFWYFFPILQHKNFQHAKIVTSASEKVGGIIPPSPKSGGPIPLSPCSDAYGRGSLKGVGWGDCPPKLSHEIFGSGVYCAFGSGTGIGEPIQKRVRPIPFLSRSGRMATSTVFALVSVRESHPGPKKASHQTLLLRYQGVNRLTRVYILTL